MNCSQPPTHVTFDNQSPDTIEVRPVTSMDLISLVIPSEAVSFQFVTEMPDAPPKTLPWTVDREPPGFVPTSTQKPIARNLPTWTSSATALVSATGPAASNRCN